MRWARSEGSAARAKDLRDWLIGGAINRPRRPLICPRMALLLLYLFVGGGVFSCFPLPYQPPPHPPLSYQSRLSQCASQPFANGLHFCCMALALFSP